MGAVGGILTGSTRKLGQTLGLTFFVLSVLLSVIVLASPARASCEREAFETAVDEAAAALRELNSKNRPSFQNKLRELKTQRGWSDDQFMAEAAPFVKDERTIELDEQTADLLGRIASLGQEGSTASVPDCTMLDELRGLMSQLVDAQVAKWGHMFEKLEAELAPAAP